MSLNSLGALAAIIAVMAVLWVLHPKPQIASDPAVYSSIAHSIASGESVRKAGSTTFSHRVAVTWPMAVFYRMLGVSPTSTHLWSLVTGMLGVILVWFAAPPGNARPAAALLLALNPLYFNHTTVVYPDITAATYMFLSVFCLKNRHRGTDSRITMLALALGGVLGLFIAFLSKASAVWVVPFWVGVLGVDIMQRRMRSHYRFYLVAAGIAVALGATYLLVCDWFWGSPWARLDAMSSVEGQHLWSWSDKTRQQLIDRIIVTPVYPLLGFAVPAFGLSLGSMVAETRRMATEKLYLLVVLAFWWFGSTSLSSYEPLPLSPRMMIPMLIPASVIGGDYLAGFLGKRNKNASLRVILGWLIGMGWIGLAGRLALEIPREIHPDTPMISIVLGALLGLGLLTIFRRRILRTAIAWSAVFVLIGAPLAFSNPLKGDEVAVAELGAMTRLKAYMANNEGSVIVLCADHRSPRFLRYYFGYKYPRRLSVRRFNQKHYQEVYDGHDHVLLFLNQRRSNRLRMMYNANTHESQMAKISRETGNRQTLYDAMGIELISVK